MVEPLTFYDEVVSLTREDFERMVDLLGRHYQSAAPPGSIVYLNAGQGIPQSWLPEKLSIDRFHVPRPKRRKRPRL